MNFIKLTDPLGVPAYLSPAEVVCIGQHESVTRIYLRAGARWRWVQVKDSPSEVVKQIEEATKGTTECSTT